MLSRRSLMDSASRHALGLALLPGLVAAQGRAPDAPMPALGSVLPVPSVQLLDGRAWGPAQAEGKVLVLYWWASWCPFCAEQSPLMNALWRTQRSQGMEVLGLSVDKTPAAAIGHLRAKGYEFPSAMALEVNKVWPKPRGLPVVVVRGRDTKVVLAEAGSLFPEDVEGLKKFL